MTTVVAAILLITAIPVLATAALAGILRLVPATAGPYLLDGVGLDHARWQITDALWAATDTRWGFPSGFFAVAEQARPDVVVAYEQTVSGSLAPSLAETAWRTPMSWANSRDDVWLMTIISMLAALVAVPLMSVVWVWETAARRLLRSTITAALTSEPGGTRIHLTGNGLSSRGAMRMLAAAFDPPRLPFSIRRSINHGN